MKNVILEKIFNILADNGIKIRIDVDNDIIIDTNRFRIFRNKKQRVNYAWKSIDDFLFKHCVNGKETCSEFLNGKFYCNYCVFDLFQRYDITYLNIMQHEHSATIHNNDMQLVQFHNAYKTLRQIRGNSLEEIAIKLDLLDI